MMMPLFQSTAIFIIALLFLAVSSTTSQDLVASPRVRTRYIDRYSSTTGRRNISQRERSAFAGALIARKSFQDSRQNNNATSSSPVDTDAPNTNTTPPAPTTRSPDTPPMNGTPDDILERLTDLNAGQKPVSAPETISRVLTELYEGLNISFLDFMRPVDVQSFSLYDVDRNGVLSVSEYASAFEVSEDEAAMVISEFTSGMMELTLLEHSDLAYFDGYPDDAELFDAADVDPTDGRLSPTELATAFSPPLAEAEAECVVEWLLMRDREDEEGGRSGITLRGLVDYLDNVAGIDDACAVETETEESSVGDGGIDAKGDDDDSSDFISENISISSSGSSSNNSSTTGTESKNNGTESSNNSSADTPMPMVAITPVPDTLVAPVYLPESLLPAATPAPSVAPPAVVAATSPTATPNETVSERATNTPARVLSEPASKTIFESIFECRIDDVIACWLVALLCVMACVILCIFGCCCFCASCCRQQDDESEQYTPGSSSSMLMQRIARMVSTFGGRTRGNARAATGQKHAAGMDHFNSGHHHHYNHHHHLNNPLDQPGRGAPPSSMFHRGGRPVPIYRGPTEASMRYMYDDDGVTPRGSRSSTDDTPRYHSSSHDYYVYRGEAPSTQTPAVTAQANNEFRGPLLPPLPLPMQPLPPQLMPNPTHPNPPLLPEELLPPQQQQFMVEQSREKNRVGERRSSRSISQGNRHFQRTPSVRASRGVAMMQPRQQIQSSANSPDAQLQRASRHPSFFSQLDSGGNAVRIKRESFHSSAQTPSAVVITAAADQPYQNTPGLFLRGPMSTPSVSEFVNFTGEGDEKNIASPSIRTSSQAPIRSQPRSSPRSAPPSSSASTPSANQIPAQTRGPKSSPSRLASMARLDVMLAALKEQYQQKKHTTDDGGVKSQTQSARAVTDPPSVTVLEYEHSKLRRWWHGSSQYSF